MNQSLPLDHEDRDSKNRLGCDLLGLVGNHYRHHSNGKVYEVVGIDWLGETDEWGVRHAEVLGANRLNGVHITRSFDNFFATVSPGRHRMTQTMQG